MLQSRGRSVGAQTAHSEALCGAYCITCGACISTDFNLQRCSKFWMSSSRSTSVSSDGDMSKPLESSSNFPESASEDGIPFAGTPQTSLATLLARVQDAHNPEPILNDTWSIRIMENIKGVNFDKLHVDATQMTAMLLRAKTLDRWAQEFLHEHPESTILQLGCGLDSRCLRLKGGERSRWVDVDLPPVIEYRRKVMADIPVDGDYSLVASSVLGNEWLRDAPADRPTLILMEGLLEYLEKADVERLIRRLVDHFPSGQLVFDAVGSVTACLGNMVKGPVRASGTMVVWTLDNPRTIERLHPKITLCDVQRLQEHEDFGRMPWLTWCQVFVASWVPLAKNTAFNLRYTF